MKHLKKWLCAGMAPLVLTGLCCPVAFAEGETVLYEYDSATASEDWGYYTGNWTFDENGISVENDGNDVWFFAYTGADEGWTDYVVEVDLINVAEGGVIVRCTDPENGVDSFGGYVMAYDSAYAFVGMDDNNSWKTLPDDGPDAPAAAAMGYASSMHWKIVVRGDTLTWYVDGSTVPSVQVQDSTYSSGGVGVRFKVFEGDESGSFANLKVYELTEEKEPQPTESTTPSTQREITTNPTTTESAPGDNTDDPSPTDTDLTWVWIVAAVVVVAAVAVAIVVVVHRKKHS